MRQSARHRIGMAGWISAAVNTFSVIAMEVEVQTTGRETQQVVALALPKKHSNRIVFAPSIMDRG